MPKVIRPPDEDKLIARAVRACGERITIQEATVQELAGRNYVVLPRAYEPTPVVFRLHLNGELRRMLQPPPELLNGDDQ